jgi:hypothetical protein
MNADGNQTRKVQGNLSAQFTMIWSGKLAADKVDHTGVISYNDGIKTDTNFHVSLTAN